MLLFIDLWRNIKISNYRINQSFINNYDINCKCNFFIRYWIKNAISDMSYKNSINLMFDKPNTIANCTYVITHENLYWKIIIYPTIIIYLVLYNLYFSGSSYILQQTLNCYDSAHWWMTWNGEEAANRWHDKRKEDKGPKSVTKQNESNERIGCSVKKKRNYQEPSSISSNGKPAYPSL